ncbi:aminotransferase class IV family protein [Candidatus Sulfurimonas baltica]|uniref:Aminotransferase class IV n=1 Tax=Candidatus Sulfurimonas baltica TaxID=2740404 RepID=A0A7S7LU99_9BACT|nr:aminotransferase class IV family protein [Candidatus Sulfurimonas baltica]QOY51602.1 aminotransferase class IV [Candidatus Sulfurimonas baltica]
MNNVFLETIRAVDGEIFHLSYHQKRYESVLESFGINEPMNIKELLNPPKIGIYRCRLIYDISKVPHVIDVTYHEYKKKEVNSLKLVFSNEIDYPVKSVNRDEIDALYNERDDADEILIIKNLLVCDTSIANIAFYSNGEWITSKKPLLKGTTRARLLDEGKIVEADIKVQDIRNFSKVALLNAMVDFYVLDRCEFLI